MSQLLRQARRRLVVEAVRSGATPREVAARYFVSLRSVQRWGRACRFVGVQGVVARPIPGRPRRLTEPQRSQLFQALLSWPSVVGYEGQKWTYDLVTRFVADRFGVRYNRGHVGRLLKSIGWPPGPPTPPPPPPPPGPDGQFGPTPPPGPGPWPFPPGPSPEPPPIIVDQPS